MERISINPREVRCLGNIVDPKNASDFQGNVSGTTEVINGQNMNVFSCLPGIGDYFNHIGVTRLVKTLTCSGDVISYTTMDVSLDMVVSDLVGCVKNLRFENEVIKYDTFTSSSNGDNNVLSNSDISNLSGVVTSLSLSGDTIVFTKI